MSQLQSTNTAKQAELKATEIESLEKKFEQDKDKEIVIEEFTPQTTSQKPWLTLLLLI